MPRPLGFNSTLVLQAVAQGRAWGFAVMEATGLASGIVYPLLRRLEARGLVTSRWEEGEEPQTLGRPRRRYYEASREGRDLLARSIEHHLARRRLLEGDIGERRS